MPFIHYHIFKNAGSSVDRALADLFGERRLDFEGAAADDVQSSEAVRKFVSEHPEIEALSTHLGRPPVPPGFFPIAFLRHPIDRAASVHRYWFQKRGWFNQTDLSFPDWIDWALAAQKGLVVRNYQTVHFSSASFTAGGILNATATEANLAEAIDTLASWRFVGIVEEFAKSIEGFNVCYREQLAGKQLKVFRANTTREDELDELGRLAEIESELGSRRYRQLVAANELDMRLYSHFKSKF